MSRSLPSHTAQAPVGAATSLDPTDWARLRDQGHRMLDDMFDHLQSLRDQTVWQPIAHNQRAAFTHTLPRQATDLADVHRRFMAEVLPFGCGNNHPRFMGWVQGGGTVEGMLAEMLAAGMNANLGGRDQMPLEVERQIGVWMRELFQFPDTSEGLFVTGASAANLHGVLMARTHHLGAAVRSEGLGHRGTLLRAYAGCTAHECITKAIEVAGLGSHALRKIAVDSGDRMCLQALSAQIAADRAAGLQPFLVVGTAGSVNTGAIDVLDALADLCREQGLWFHIDGALGALGMLSPTLAQHLKGIERADSLALDFHKWGQVPYDAGYILVRDGANQLQTFATEAAYLARHPRGLAAGSPWPCDRGTDLSRGFRALKTWFTFMTHGTEKLGASIDHSCTLAQHLQTRIEACPELELLSPARLNIVCFRYHPDNSHAQSLCALNQEIIADLHERGIAVPSATTVNGQVAIRAAIVNHRTTHADIDALVDGVVQRGRERTGYTPAKPALLGMAALLRKGFQKEDLQTVARSLIARAETDESDANALMDLSTVLQVQGQRELGLAAQSLALQTRRLYELPAEQPGGPHLLALCAEGDLMLNAPLPFLFEHSDVHLSMLYLRAGEALPQQLPPHDLAVVAMGATQDTHALLQQLAEKAPDWNTHLLLRPGNILRTRRDQAHALLADVKSICMVPTWSVARGTLEGICAGTLPLQSVFGGTSLPLIIRPLDSHAGHDLEKVNDLAALQSYLQAHGDQAFYVSPFVDYSDADGLFRKYRVVLIDGKPYAGHMGISSHWMVHYLNAGMAESAAKRAEEAQFMRDFDQVFAKRHAHALQAIDQRFGLEYLVIDCAQTRDGRLLVFELDPGAVVHAMDPADMFPYKVPAMQKVFQAFRAMLGWRTQKLNGGAAVEANSAMELMPCD